MKKDLKITWIKPDRLKPSPKNVNTHPVKQLAQIIASLKEFGWTKPIVVDEKQRILAGHGAWMAAQQLDMPFVPAVEKRGLTVAQKRQYLIADNKIARGAEWDETMLAQEFRELGKMGADLGLTGFEPQEIDAFLAPLELDPEEPPIPDMEKKAVSCLGDMWLLGKHRLICGDSTKPGTLKVLMGQRKAQCVYTDPPYGVSYVARSGQFEMIKGDELRRGQLTHLLHGAFATALPFTQNDAGWYVWHASATREDFAAAMRDTGLVENAYIVWVKPNINLVWSDYRWAHEPCFYAARQGVKPAFHGGHAEPTVWRARASAAGANTTTTSIGTGLVLSAKDGSDLYLTADAPKAKKVRHIHVKPGELLCLEAATEGTTVWEVSRDKGDAIHPNQKPTELARRALKNSTFEGEFVLDMFAGSGSTLMAAEQIKRVACCVELDPHYVDAIIRRWQNYTGKQAVHAADEKTFEEIAKNKSPR